MALLTTLFTALSRKLGDFLQTVFGWSIAAMFGRMSSNKQTLISIALVLSLFWPVFVIGVFVPSAIAFFVAFIPIKNLIPDFVLRIIWIALAVIAPIIVGLLTRLVAPELRAKGFFASILNGYPLAIGYAGSFLITLFVVPAIKLSTLKRGWSEEHIFVQARRNHYIDAFRELCDACSFAGLHPRAAPAPRSMNMATRLLRFFARGAIDSLVVENPLMVRAKEVELFLYPGDLLIRGSKPILARVRAMIGNTQLERHAYLVQKSEAMDLQDDLIRLWDVIARHEHTEEIGPTAYQRLKEIVVESSQSQLTFDEWMVLDRLSRRVESALLGKRSLVDEASVTRPTDMEKLMQAPKPQPVQAVSSDDSIFELVEKGLKEAHNLVKLEVELAKAEATQQLKDVAKAAVGFVLAGASLVVMLALLGMALVLAIGGTAIAALGVAGGFLVLGAVLGAVGYSLLPKDPLKVSRKHLVRDLKQLKEHVA